MSVHIEILGNKAKLIGENDYIFLENLDLELSYKQLGSEYSKAYIHGKWDGRRRLLTSSLYFPVGLVPRVVNFYNSCKKEISVVDKNTYSENNPTDITPRLKELKKLPRYYQIDSANKAIDKKRGIIRVCTGGGKTLIAALIIAAIGKKTVFYVVGKDLLWQAHKFFEAVFQKKIGIVGDGVCEIEDITIASIWSVGKALGMGKIKPVIDDDIIVEKEVNEIYYKSIRDMIVTSKLNIMDEVHMAAAETMQRISTEVIGEYNIGMSASPTRDDDTNLLIESIFGKIIINVSASELIKNEFLVKPIIKFLPIPKLKGLSGKTYREIYKESVVNNDYRNGVVVKAAKSLLEQEFTILILYREIAHGKILYNMLKAENINCDILSGNDSTDVRKGIINNIENGECKLVLASAIFDFDIDISKLDALILAAQQKAQSNVSKESVEY